VDDMAEREPNDTDTDGLCVLTSQGETSPMTGIGIWEGDEMTTRGGFLWREEEERSRKRKGGRKKRVADGAATNVVVLLWWWWYC
jgi:hypothetical protein